jgi:hypothetical protein
MMTSCNAQAWGSSPAVPPYIFIVSQVEAPRRIAQRLSLLSARELIHRTYRVLAFANWWMWDGFEPPKT